MIKIDKGIPISEIKHPDQPRRRMFPLQEMEVGDSFFIPNRKINSITGSVYYATKKTGYRYVARTVEENGVKGVRIWRIE